jgi:UDP-N-acetylglucosamine diphosphorylase/glucosamine-1-phosphate N-acetyltransferase
VRLYLFDEAATDSWHPFSLTRPACELLFGTVLLRERLERFAGRPASAILTRPWLASFQEEGAPPARHRSAPPADEERLFLSSTFVPSVEARFEGRGATPLLLMLDELVVGCYLPAGSPGPNQQWLEAPAGNPADVTCERRPVDGGLVDAAWRLISENPGRLAADLARDAASRGGVARLPEGTWKLGSEPLMLGAETRVEPGVVFDTRHGPIRLDDAVEVRAGCRLEGPLFVGRSTILLGGAIGTSSIGPVCRIRGEVEESVVLGYTNKAHDGFLGHAYLGRWVNLGAMTTNSDLKNNYGPVRLGSPQGPIETGLTKLGCLLGDHVKTAIGTRINTGTVVGAGANLFGDSVPPTWVRPFSWGHAADPPTFERDRFLQLAERVLERRQVEWSDETEAWLEACWSAANPAVSD